MAGGGGICPFTLTGRLLYHASLTGVLLLVTSCQGVLLDIFILAFDKKTSLNYFWLLPDFLLVFPFVGAMCGGYRKAKDPKRQSAKSTSQSTPHTPHSKAKIQSVQSRFFGTSAEPFYVWLAYSCLLVAKIAVIFTSEIPNRINLDAFLSPQLLQLTVSMTALVFGLLVEGQTAWRVETCTEEEQKARDTYIRSLSHGTALETLDTVAFLSLLVQSESSLVLPLSLERLILGLACVNLFLPALTLVKLSHSDYGNGRLGRVNHILPIVYRLVHLFLTNISFMVIRIYLWAGLSLEISPFLVKNIYHIFSVLREVWAECHGFCGLRNKRDAWLCISSWCTGCGGRRKRRGKALKNGRENSDWLEEVEGEASGSGDKFEEIDLKPVDRV